jgi:hypothetical protein
MAEFFAIITNFGTAPRVSAHLDVSVDTRTGPGPVDVLFNVYDARGVQLAEFAVPTNANGLASSSTAGANANLFVVSGGQPAIVRARTPATTTVSTAVLHQSQPGSRLVVGIPPARRSNGTPLNAGQVFPIALGRVAAATLLITNVSGGDAGVDVFVGTAGGVGAGKHTTPRLTNNALWRVDLDAADQDAHLIVSATAEVVVQLMIDDGRINALTCVPS